jgi:ATP-dependent Clp protease ATP-binding subunit ClpA
MMAARAVFPLEFLNRFDDILVYSTLGRTQLEQIFGKFLAEIHERALLQARVPFLIKVSQESRNFILDCGFDPTLGARPLRRAIEVELVDPLSRLLATERIESGDVIDVESENGRLVFYRRPRAESDLVV